MDSIRDIRELERTLATLDKHLGYLAEDYLWLGHTFVWPPVKLLTTLHEGGLRKAYSYLSNYFGELGFTPEVLKEIRVLHYAAKKIAILLVDKNTRPVQ
jgi:hypothetical protein